MPRIEISDGAIMALNGIVSIADGAHQVIAPQHYEDFHFGPKVLHPLRSYAPDEMVRYNGHAHLALGALTLAARNHLTPGGSRPFFNTSGAIFATAAGMAAVNARRDKQRKASGYTKAAVLGTVAALNLWRGLKPNDSKIHV